MSLLFSTLLRRGRLILSLLLAVPVVIIGSEILVLGNKACSWGGNVCHSVCVGSGPGKDTRNQENHFNERWQRQQRPFIQADTFLDNPSRGLEKPRERSSIEQSRVTAPSPSSKLSLMAGQSPGSSTTIKGFTKRRSHLLVIPGANKKTSAVRSLNRTHGSKQEDVLR